jgi:hypothetical protein
MPESRWGAPDRKLSADLADANKRLAAYRELADDRGYYLRHNIPGLREEIKDTRPEISLSQIMVTKRASVVSTATQAEPSNSAAYHALQLAMTGKQFEFNADRVAFAKVTDARLPERINDKEVEIAVPESLGVAREAGSWVNDNGDPVADLTSEIRQTAQGNEAEDSDFKAAAEEHRQAGLEWLREQERAEMEPAPAIEASESGGAISPDRLSDKAFDAASKLWNTDARADVAAQAGDVPEEEKEGWFQRAGGVIGTVLDRAGDKFDAWTRRPEPEEIARPTVTPVIVRAEDVGEALRLAREMKAQARAADVARVMEAPGVDTKREAKWILFKAEVQSRLSHPFSTEYRSADREVRIQGGIDSVTDRKADKLLKEHGEAVSRIDPRKEIGPHNAHLLPAKEYQAALRVHQIDQRLRELRPESETVGEAHARARGQISERVEAPRVAETAGVRQEGLQLVQRSVVNERPYAAALEALTAYKDGAVRLEGWQKDPIKAMRKTLQDQLNGAASMEAAGRTPDRIDLSVKYNGEPGTNITTAREAHTAAIKANKDFIDLVRSYVPVDEGKVTFVSAGEFQKKSEAVSNGIGSSA